MQDPSINFKAKLNTARHNFIVLLQSMLDEDNLTHFNASQQNGYYELLPEDNSLIKNCKLLLNILACLGELTDSLVNVTAITKLKESMAKIELRSLMELQGLFKNLYEQCPLIFTMVCQGCLNGLNQLPGDATGFLTTALTSIYKSLNVVSVSDDKNGSHFLDYVKDSFATLQALEHGKQAETRVQKIDIVAVMEQPDTTTEWLEKIQIIIVEAIDKNFGDVDKLSFIDSRDKLGNYQALVDDAVAVVNIKQVLNGLNGLAKIYHTWNQWSNGSIIATLAQIYANVRAIADAYYQLLSDQSIKMLAGSINRVLSTALYSMNDLMRDFAIYLDNCEIQLGVKTGYLLEQLAPVFKSYEELAQAAAVKLDETERYPYFVARLAALNTANRQANREVIVADIKLKKLIKINNILLKYNHAPLSDYDLKELKALKRNISLFKLSETDQKEYLRTLNDAITTKAAQTIVPADQPPAADGNNQTYFNMVNNIFWSGLQKVKQSTEQVGNYMGITLHSVVMEQVAKETRVAQNEKRTVEFQSKVVVSHLNAVSVEHAVNLRHLAEQEVAAQKTSTNSAVAADSSMVVSEIVMPDSITRFKTGLNTVKNVFIKLADFLIDKLITRELAAASKSDAVELAPVVQSEQIQHKSKLENVSLNYKPVKYEQPVISFSLSEKPAKSQQPVATAVAAQDDQMEVSSTISPS